MDQGFTLWLTGLSGAGKTTIAGLVEERLLELGLLAEVLDGREVRKMMGPDPGFGPEARELQARRLTYVSALLNRNGVISIVAAVSPIKSVRNTVRSQLPLFLEVFVDCPIEVCRQRGADGLYARAGKGEITQVAGLDFPYEPPDKPEVVVHTDRETPQESAVHILRTLEILSLIPSSGETDYSGEDEEIIKRHLTDLGYL